MQHQAEQQARRWLEQARHDLEDAHFSLRGGRFSLACFLAQQSAEKALKAFLYFKASDFVLGHSVADLCEDAAKFAPEFATLKRILAPLDKYYITTRYPDALPGGLPWQAFDKNDAERSIQLAEEALQAVAQKIGAS